MTHTFAVLDVSPACFEEIKARLEAVNYEHVFTKVDGKLVIDMNGIAIRRENDDVKVRAWLMFEGRKVSDITGVQQQVQGENKEG